MGTIRKYSKGYRAEICVKRVRESATFRTKREAEVWTCLREEALRNEGTKPASAKYTLAEALNRYAKEESPKRRGSRWETIRIATFLRDSVLKPDRPIGEVTTVDLPLWRDNRLKQVGSGTVKREMVLLAAVFETARREWLWGDKNLTRDVRLPRAPDHRERLITLAETRAMLKVMGYPFRRCGQVSHAAAAVFLMGLRTGMRAGEICKLKWEDVKDDHLVDSSVNTFTNKAFSVMLVSIQFDKDRVMSRKSGRAPLVLTDEQKVELIALAGSRTAPLREVERAKILLSYATGLSISEIGRCHGVSRPTIYKCLDKALAAGVRTGLKDTYSNSLSL